MADEISYELRLAVSKGSLDFVRELRNQVATMTGDAVSHQTQDIPTTAAGTALDIATAVVNQGWAVFVNQDDTNYIEIGAEDGGTFYPVIKLLAGEGCLVRCASGLSHAVANTATVALEFFILEE